MPTRDTNNIENPSGLELPYQGKTLSLRHLNKTTEALQAMTRGARVPNQLAPDFDPHLHNTLRLVCVNNTGHEYEVGEAIGLLDLDTDEPKDIVKQQVAEGRIPQKDDRGKFFIVVHEGGEKNAVLKVACEGIQRAKVYVGDAAGAGMVKKWKFADIDHKSTGNKWNLSLMPYGSARVLWMDGNGGAYRDCLIKFQNHAFAADLNPYQVPEDGDTWSKWRHELPDAAKLGVEAEVEFSDGVARKMRFDAKGHLVRICAGDEAECPTPTPTPSATATPTDVDEPTPTPTPADSGTPTPTSNEVDDSSCGFCGSTTPASEFTVTWSLYDDRTAACGACTPSKLMAGTADVVYKGENTLSVQAGDIWWSSVIEQSGTKCDGRAYDTVLVEVIGLCNSRCSGQLAVNNANLAVTYYTGGIGGSSVGTINAKCTDFDCLSGGTFTTTGLTSCCASVDDTKGSATVS